MNVHYTLNAGQPSMKPLGSSSLPIWAEEKFRTEFNTHVQNSLNLSQKMDSIADTYLSDPSTEDFTFYLIFKANTTSLAYVLSEIFELQHSEDTSPESPYSAVELDTFRLGIHEAQRLSSTILDSVNLYGEKYFSIQDTPDLIRDFSSMNQHIRSINERKMFNFTDS